MIFTLSLALQQELGQILSARAAEVVRLEKEEIKKAEEVCVPLYIIVSFDCIQSFLAPDLHYPDRLLSLFF